MKFTFDAFSEGDIFGKGFVPPCKLKKLQRQYVARRVTSLADMRGIFDVIYNNNVYVIVIMYNAFTVTNYY